MEWKDHALQVGCIITNLQALETVLRCFLMEAHGEKMQFPKPGDLDAEVTYLTKHIYLSDLVKQYNARLGQAEKKFEVDTEVTKIRNAVAHGRLVTSTGQEELPYRLWKFARRPTNGRVKIEFEKELTLDWLTEKTNWIEREKQKVVNCSKERGYRRLR